MAKPGIANALSSLAGQNRSQVHRLVPVKLLAFFPDFLKKGGHVDFTKNKHILRAGGQKILSLNVVISGKDNDAGLFFDLTNGAF